MSVDEHVEPIPQPPGYPVVGNLFDLKSDAPILKLMKLAKEYGPIFRLKLGSGYVAVLSSHELVNEICDDTKFDKFIGTGVRLARSVGGDGLFTAWTHEKNWHKAHNILLPSFGPRAIRDYAPEMGDIAMQLVEKWARLNPGEEIDVAADMTRLTLDTIGLCAFDYRFNSLYRQDNHPFVAAMTSALSSAQKMVTKLPIQRKLMVRAQRERQEHISVMNGLVDQIIAERRADPNQAEKADLLQAMLGGVDAQTGEQLDDINIRYQVLTFLVAGHETTSGLLTFAIYYLLQNPDVLAKAYAEVDEVLRGDLTAPPNSNQLRQLRYIDQILKETLRLWPTAPIFSRHCLEPTKLGGRYEIGPDHQLMTLIPSLHRDPAVWGDDAEAFRPERFDKEAEANLPPNAFKAFGTGQRACIGRHFALQEAVMALGMILQRFEMEAPEDYELKLIQTLTIKPVGYRIKVKPRTDRPAVLARSEQAQEVKHEEAGEIAASRLVPAQARLLVLYGSNLGTSEEIAHRIAEDGTLHGFEAQVAPLDDHVDDLPRDGAVVIVTSSYNGTPPDNAATFFEWITGQGLTADSLKGVNYTVFGCGDRDWPDTYQRVPQMIDAAMAGHGATRLYQRGEGDQRDDSDGQFRGWYDHLWTTLADELGISVEAPEPMAKGHRFEVEVLSAPSEAASLIAEYGAHPMTVTANRELQNKAGDNPSERSTRHIEFALPQGMTYREGDHLGILPRNHPEIINRVMARFDLPANGQVRLRNNATGKTFLPTDEPIALDLLLGSYLALQDPARRSDIEVLADYTECPPEKAKLEAMASDDPDAIALYRKNVLEKNVSLIDLLEDNPSCALPFNVYIELTQVLKPRYYSISSSPMVDVDRCSITVGVVEGEARSGHGTYRGVSSGFLAGVSEGQIIEGFVRPPSVPFVPPEDASTPMIMVGAGTGLAPYMGFLQRRLAEKQAGKHVGPSLLFFGCRSPDQDSIYAGELKAFADAGIVDLEYAFSRQSGQAKTYVQDRMQAEASKLYELLEQDAVVYVCGDASTMAPAVEAAMIRVYQDATGAAGQSASAWMAELKAANRYLVDIWPRS